MRIRIQFLLSYAIIALCFGTMIYTGYILLRTTHRAFNAVVEEVGSRLRRDDLVSVVYSTELNSNTSLATPQRIDRHGILGQKPSGFQLLLS